MRKPGASGRAAIQDLFVVHSADENVGVPGRRGSIVIALAGLLEDAQAAL